ncbi:hypothetical protein ACF09G_31900 [Streptomyces albogriseolus]|uniref:hypothetical protein n=1 Tax=Streptomyces TaxID=1883 RepID=UPI001AA0E9A8|nr:hypothetical protein [Streptomyces sp. GC420]
MAVLSASNSAQTEACVLGGEEVEVGGELSRVAGVPQQLGDHLQVGTGAGGAGGAAERVVQVPQGGEPGVDRGGDFDADVAALDPTGDGVLDVLGPLGGEVFEDRRRQERDVGAVREGGVGGQVVEGGQRDLRGEGGQDVGSGQGEQKPTGPSSRPNEARVDPVKVGLRQLCG